MGYQKTIVPDQGARITVNAALSFNVPDQPTIPYIEGDAIGVDITPVMRHVVDAAIDKAFSGQRSINENTPRPAVPGRVMRKPSYRSYSCVAAVQCHPLRGRRRISPGSRQEG